MLRSLVLIALGVVLTAVIVIAGEVAMGVVAPEVFDEDSRVVDLGAQVLLALWFFVAAAFSAWVVARLAAIRPLAHAMALGGVHVTGAVLVALFLGDMLPLWYHGVTIAHLMPAAWIGGAIAASSRLPVLARG